MVMIPDPRENAPKLTAEFAVRTDKGEKPYPTKREATEAAGKVEGSEVVRRQVTDWEVV